jgi:hypothetical protein
MSEDDEAAAMISIAGERELAPEGLLTRRERLELACRLAGLLQCNGLDADVLESPVTTH